MPTKDERTPSQGTVLLITTHYSGGDDSGPSGSEMSSRGGVVLNGQTKTWGNTPNYWSVIKKGSKTKVRWRKGRPYFVIVPTSRVLGPQPLDLVNATGSATFRAIRTGPWDGFSLPGGPYRDVIEWVGDAAGLEHSCEPDYIPDLVSDFELALKARSALQEDRTWRAPLFAAELGKSVDMITDAARRLVYGLRAIKRFDFARADMIFGAAGSGKKGRGVRGVLTDSLANNWLAYKYGWMPLLMDVHDAAKALWAYQQDRPSADSPQRLVVKSTRSMTFTAEATLQVSPAFKIAGPCTVKTSKRLLLEWWVSDPSAYAAASFGLTNPLAIAWELVPYSFVADWFLPIGDLVNSLDALTGVTIGRTWQGYKREVSFDPRTVVLDYFNSPNSKVHGTYREVRVKRDILGGLGYPLPSEIPIRLSLSTAQFASATALLHGAFRH